MPKNLTSVFIDLTEFLPRFGEGYIVGLRVKGNSPNLEPVKNYFEENFPDAVLKVGCVLKIYTEFLLCLLFMQLQGENMEWIRGEILYLSSTSL